ncbi:ATP-binding cassette domain-containing protein [Clostridium tertium]|uniref:ATP-binding cassette domain-containing protein n=1 Tax=Clostridium tertium TaxID=1559 RepID=UPI00241DD575|nr:ATP-binding cassette domain-containing protein [Clostridium tertium]
MILKMVDVEYKYKDRNKLILKNINVEFEKGKVYVITGKSGSGKSVLLGIISGLDDCTSGNIIYKEKNLKDINRDVYRNSCIGAIFKDYNLLSNTTILDNISLPINRKRKREPDKRELIEDILNVVGIDKGKLNIKVERLSDEEKKGFILLKHYLTIQT